MPKWIIVNCKNQEHPENINFFGFQHNEHHCKKQKKQYIMLYMIKIFMKPENQTYKNNNIYNYQNTKR